LGYSTGNLAKLGDLIRSNEFAGRRIIDFGSQDLKIFSRDDLSTLQSFVGSLGGPRNYLDKTREEQFPLLLTAIDVFTAAGFQYTCCDVDQRPGTVYVDYNTLKFDRSLYGKFDIVANVGTTEHLPNPVAALFLMHWMCRTGGILFNEVPLSGWTNHGLNNLTAKFWHTLRWMNSYEVLSAKIKYSDLGADNENVTGPHLDFIENLRRAGENSATIEIVFRKTSDRGFVVPYDAVLPQGDGGKAIAKLVMGSLGPFVKCGALTHKQAVETTDAFLAYQNLPYRQSARFQIRGMGYRKSLPEPLQRLIPKF
jgi:hypothetical protein